MEDQACSIKRPLILRPKWIGRSFRTLQTRRSFRVRRSFFSPSPRLSPRLWLRPGRISALLAKRGFRVLGVDPSPEMISVASKQRLDDLNVEFQLCEARPLEAQREAFDAVVCSSVIEYESRPVELLHRFAAALRPSGALIISFANSSSLSRALFQRRNLHLGAQVHTWSGQEFTNLLEQGGFPAESKCGVFRFIS